jgi:hypothetical protein
MSSSRVARMPGKSAPPATINNPPDATHKRIARACSSVNWLSGASLMISASSAS